MAVAEDRQQRGRPGQQVRALAQVRKLRAAVRDALPALHALEEAADLDVWGRYEVPAGTQVDTDDLAAWLALARADYPGQPLEILLVAHVGR